MTAGRSAALALAFGLAAAPAFGATVCPDGLRPHLVAELLLGRNIGPREGVSESAFRAFLRREVAPRFPDGFTILDARGAYRDAASGRTREERGKLLLVAMPDPARQLPLLREVAEAYRARFRQQSVGLIAREACAAF